MATERCQWCGEWIEIPMTKERRSSEMIKVRHFPASEPGEKALASRMLFCSKDCLMDWAVENT